MKINNNKIFSTPEERAIFDCAIDILSHFDCSEINCFNCPFFNRSKQHCKLLTIGIKLDKILNKLEENC